MEDNVTITRKEYIHLLEFKLVVLKDTLNGMSKDRNHLYDSVLNAITELVTHLNDVKALSMNELDK